ncbi:MAG: Sfum_1244 family protein, partial [Bacillota bacterium]
TLQGDTIFLRREAFERWLWLRAEVWESREGSASMRSALSLYGYDGDRRAALARMAEAERETLILHELGEHAAGRRLGPEWEDLMEGLADRRAEMAARAVRDLLADCLVTLPVLVQRNAVASLHFWFANFTGMRRMLFPLLAQAREAWCAGSDDALAQAIGAGAPHWERVARDLAALGAGVARRVAEGEAGFIL